MLLYWFCIIVRGYSVSSAFPGDGTLVGDKRLMLVGVLTVMGPVRVDVESEFQST
jgi:hypothetical protein